MAAIEVVDTIETKPEEVVPLDDENISIVEINAQDILSDFEEETKENLKEEGDGDSNPRKIKTDNVKVQPSKETDQSNDKELQKNKEIDMLHVVPGNKLSDYFGQKSIDEMLFLNYSDQLTGEQEHYKKFREIQKRVQDKSLFKVEKKEITVLPDKRYRCNHCRFVNTNREKMYTHIRHNHKVRLVTPEIYKSSLEKQNETSDATSFVSWFEYTPEDDDHYRCNHCLIVMQGQKETEQHILENHRRLKINQCPYCPHQSKHNLRTHIKCVHNDEKDYRCELCDFKTKLKSSLRRHILNKHQGLEKRFVCSKCPKRFGKSDHLTRHVRYIHDLEKIICFHCSYESRSKTGLIYHIQTRHMKMDSLETLQCKLCSFKTKFKGLLHNHNARYHRQVKICHICSYTCRGKPHLTLHLMTHKERIEDKDLKYRCDQCDYKTYRSYSLQVHKLKHKKPEEIQYFYCYHCDFKAKRKDNLKSHIFRHDKKKDIEYECYICYFKTIKKDVLVRHINKHSKESKNQLIILKTEVTLK